MDPATGAIVPSDLRPGGRESTLTQLIIGNRDLRPRLSRLEAKADVLVIFDACFSGESVKSIEAAEMPPAKYVSLADLTDGEVSRKSLEQAERSMHTRSQSPDYPYRRVVYLAASANNQYARDINRHFLEHAQGRFSTYDGQPHGAFTNALLFLLADNGAVSPPCRILFQRAATMVRELAKLIGSAQDPQLLYSPTNPDEVEAPCLFTSSTATSTPTTRMGGLHR
jgi:hypothetical protein